MTHLALLAYLSTASNFSLHRLISAMTNPEDKIPKFMGKPNENYAMWRFRLVTTVKKKVYWKDIWEEDCSPEAQKKATNIVVSAPGDVSSSACMDQDDNPFCTIELFDARFVSARRSSLFAVLSNLFGKRYYGKEDMAQ